MRAFLNMLILGTVCAVSACAGTDQGTAYWFQDGKCPKNAVDADAGGKYSKGRGYGWMERAGSYFSVNLPEGNYDVIVGYKDVEAAANTTVKAEARRVMLKSLDSANSKMRSFTVNVRRPEIEGGGRVKLNSRETGGNDLSMVAHWDDMLTLEFLPDASGVEGIKIMPTTKAITIYIAGDSTVTDQRAEPWSGWGAMLPSFFEQGVSVANYAESGRALFSFVWEKRLDKILSVIQPGDYLFVQFGHNDQKDKREGSGPFTTYKQELGDYISQVRAKKAFPVLVTPMERRRWKNGVPQETLTDYATAMRQVAEEQTVPLIDLHAMSLKFYAAMGEEKSKSAFVHYPAHSFPNQDKAFKDDTHHNAYGAYELARCVVEGIKSEVPALAKRLRDHSETFDPSTPDDPAELGIPASKEVVIETPEGS